MTQVPTRAVYCTSQGREVAVAWADVSASRIVEGLPVRVPRSYRGSKSYPGFFWAATSNRTLVYESRLELGRLWMADFDRSVVDMATQPFQVVGYDGARLRRHVPDVLLLHSDKSVSVIDVKPRELLSRTKVQEQFAWMRTLCDQRGWDYEIYSDPDPIVLRNLSLLAMGRRPQHLPADLLQDARRLSRDAESLGAAVARCPSTRNRNDWMLALAALLWAGELRADLSLPLSYNTRLSHGKQAAYDR